MLSRILAPAQRLVTTPLQAFPKSIRHPLCSSPHLSSHKRCFSEKINLKSAQVTTSPARTALNLAIITAGSITVYLIVDDIFSNFRLQQQQRLEQSSMQQFPHFATDAETEFINRIKNYQKDPSASGSELESNSISPSALYEEFDDRFDRLIALDEGVSNGANNKANLEQQKQKV